MKNIVLYLSLAWVLLFSSAAGCSSSTDDPTPANSNGLEGTWKLTKVNGQLTIITDAKKGTTFTEYFDEESADLVAYKINLELKGGVVKGFIAPSILGTLASGTYETGQTGGLNFTFDKMRDNVTPLPNNKTLKFFTYYKISGNQLVITQTKADFLASVAANGTPDKSTQSYDLTLSYTRQ